MISANGRAVVFASYATDLVAGVTDGNQTMDLFYYDVATESVALISRSAATAGAPPAARWGACCLSCSL